MSVAHAAATPAPAARPARVARAGRVARWRTLLLVALVAGCLTGLVAAIVVFASGQVTFNRYDAIVHRDSFSVDAAISARADLLNSAAANAALLAAQSQAAKDQASAGAMQSWSSFQNDLRRSWQNLSDSERGEPAVFAAADAAQTDYDRDIGAMSAALNANPARPADATAAFLQANSVLEQRLLPALSSGLENLKVEDMSSDYASTSSTERLWLGAVVAVSIVLAVVTVLGYALTRSMHHLITLELLLALVAVALIGGWVGVQLRRADTQSKVMVKDAYNSIAGVSDEVALISQQHERESIAILDAQNRSTHYAAFDSFTLAVEQGLCGSGGCTGKPPFLATGTSDQIAASVVAAGLQGQLDFGLARPPLVSNVHFTGQAAALEAARRAYQSFLAADQSVRTSLNANNVPQAAAQSSAAGATTYAATVSALNQAGSSARSVFNSSYQSVEDAATIVRWLALGEIVVGLLLAGGLWRRRSELYPQRSA